MVLKANGQGLFPKEPLLNDVGLLKQRWDQEGSSSISVEGYFDADTTIRTVTSGKVFYLTSLLLSTTAAAGQFYLRDGGVAGTIKTILDIMGDVRMIHFAVPLRFETDVYFDEIVGTNVNLTLSGWEEDE